MPLGRVPKPDGEAITRHRKQYDWLDVPDIPNRTGPNLPKYRANGEPWSPSARRKWAAWHSMPHAALWTPADWEYALDTIELAQRFHDGNTTSAGELRLRERGMGTTADARLGLRIRYVEPRKLAVVRQAAVPRIDDYGDL